MNENYSRIIKSTSLLFGTFHLLALLQCFFEESLEWLNNIMHSFFVDVEDSKSRFGFQLTVPASEFGDPLFENSVPCELVVQIFRGSYSVNGTRRQCSVIVVAKDHLKKILWKKNLVAHQFGDYCSIMALLATMYVAAWMGWWPFKIQQHVLVVFKMQRRAIAFY